MNRRNLLSGVVPLGIVLALGVDESFAYDNPRRLRPRRALARRRFRRHAFTRVVLGRRLWVVPVGLAVGWELFHTNRVVLVREIRVVEREGRKAEIAVIQDAAGNREEVEITREDTADNSDDLAGSEIPEDGS
jgi:hypothetical protein